VLKILLANYDVDARFLFLIFIVTVTKCFNINLIKKMKIYQAS